MDKKRIDELWEALSELSAESAALIGELIAVRLAAEREAMRDVAHRVAADLGCHDRAYADELIDEAIRARK